MLGQSGDLRVQFARENGEQRMENQSKVGFTRKDSLTPLSPSSSRNLPLRQNGTLLGASEKTLNEFIARRRNPHRLVEKRILIRKLDRAQGHRRVAPRPVFGRAVHRVSNDGQPGVLQMKPDLMGAAGHMPRIEQRQAISVFNDRELG